MAVLKPSLNNVAKPSRKAPGMTMQGRFAALQDECWRQHWLDGALFQNCHLFVQKK